MFIIKGEQRIHKEFLTTLFVSVDMNKEALLYLFFTALTQLQLFEIPFDKFNTVNKIKGTSWELLTNKDNLIEWFNKIHFEASLPAIIFESMNESDIKKFLERGSKYKFLKPAHEFGGKRIHVIDSFKNVKEILDANYIERSIDRPGMELNSWILQDALENTATFDGYKFHLRVLLVVVVRDNRVSVFISNYHIYELSSRTYDIKQLKEKNVYNTHKHRNSRNAFFPMELPDQWTATHAKETNKKISTYFKQIFNKEHDFYNDFGIKNGFECFGADILIDTKHAPYIIEINHRPVIYKAQYIFFPEYIHLGLGGAPLKLFTCIYGTPEGRITPFTKPLRTFYEKTYSSALSVRNAITDLFLVNMDTDSANSYVLYQKISRKTKRTITRKNKKRM